MLSSLAKSIALGFLFAPPTSIAFTASPSLQLQRGTSSRSSSRSLLHAASAAGEESNSSPWRRATSQQEEQLNSNEIELPRRTNQITNKHNEDVNNDKPRNSEFHHLEPLLATSARRSRLDSEARSASVYVSSGSDSYWDLLDDIARYEGDLSSALEEDASDGVAESIRAKLREARARDPAHVYRVVGEEAQTAERRGDAEQGERYREECLRAKRMLPQFNLEGLWVGK